MKKHILDMDDDELDLIRHRLITKIKQSNEADKLIAFLLMIDMSEKELTEVSDAFKKTQKGAQNDSGI